MPEPESARAPERVQGPEPAAWEPELVLEQVPARAPEQEPVLASQPARGRGPALEPVLAQERGLAQEPESLPVQALEPERARARAPEPQRAPGLDSPLVRAQAPPAFGLSSH